MNDIESMYSSLDEYEPGNLPLSCFFTGHRKINSENDVLLMDLKKSISYLYSIGVTEFHAGGALGFDTFAATVVIDLKRFHSDMRLVLNLPYRNQTDGWSEINVEQYKYVMKNADEIVYTYDGEVSGKGEARKYLLKRNRDMVDGCKYGIAFYSGKQRSGTGYTINYAKGKNCEIINLYHDSEEAL